MMIYRYIIVLPIDCRGIKVSNLYERFNKDLFQSFFEMFIRNCILQKKYM